MISLRCGPWEASIFSAILLYTFLLASLSWLKLEELALMPFVAVSKSDAAHLLVGDNAILSLTHFYTQSTISSALDTTSLGAAILSCNKNRSGQLSCAVLPSRAWAGLLMLSSFWFQKNLAEAGYNLGQRPISQHVQITSKDLLQA